ncbi:MAG: HD-GYP domain-containing protein [Spirochaetes bacterium]|nr:HD-GYP domain-containing protein [Spirochaetota bacterium]
MESPTDVRTDDGEAVEDAESVPDDECADRAAFPCPGQLLSGYASRYNRSPEPIAVLDDSLRYVYRNARFEGILEVFSYPNSPDFLKTFEKITSSATRREIVESLRNPKTGYIWKGSFEHKTRDAARFITRVSVYPIHSPNPSSVIPDGYIVILDDVTRENKDFVQSIFSGLLKTSLVKDKATEGKDLEAHIKRINLYSKRLAEAMFRDPRWPEIDRDFIDEIGFLAAMHDLGKIGTPDSILDKEGPLDEEEHRIMREHTINGGLILAKYPNPMASQIAISHHEKWNGSGYPYGFLGRMIPLPARIVTVADVYDALRMKRRYKAALPHENAMKIIVADAGQHFDPDIVAVFVSMHEDFQAIFDKFEEQPRLQSASA